MRFVSILFVCFFCTGCYASHLLQEDDDCEDVCYYINESCSFNNQDFINSCIDNCQNAPRVILENEWSCADCFITQAMCISDNFWEFCSVECRT